MKKTKKINEKDFVSNIESTWDVLLISFQIIYKNIHHLAKINIKFLLSSLLIISIPVANSIMIQNIYSLMNSQGVIVNRSVLEVEKSFKKVTLKSLSCFLLQLVILSIIFISINFWISQSDLSLRFISIIAIYGLVLFFLISNYIYTTLVMNKNLSIMQCYKITILLVFKKPFESSLFTIVNILLLILGLILLGPILIIIPSSISVISYISYLYLTDNISMVNLSR